MSYRERVQRHGQTASQLKKRFNTLSLLRLAAILLALTFVVLAIRAENAVYGYVALAAFGAFLVLLRLHAAVKKQLRFAQTLVTLNETELDFLENGALPFGNGAAFHETNHPYTYDLDIFGPHSLYHQLNRTETVMGSTQLANDLKQRFQYDAIRQRQQAIAELSPLLDWRQEYTAKAQLANDNEKVVEQLRSWTDAPVGLAPVVAVLRLALPALWLALVVGFAFTGQPLFLHFSVTVFVANLLVLGSQLKRMNSELSSADKINETLLRYSELLRAIEQQSWTSESLLAHQQRLLQNGKTASEQIGQLSRLFAGLESLQNGIGAILFNGTVQYHVHIFKRLLNWKTANAFFLKEWLTIIGELEALVSFANLHYNNPAFCFPELNENYRLEFEALGHPLINASKRVCNDVHFSEQSFIILTGSNMSGKSTFLRTLGINFVLANAGSAICARKAVFHPMDVLVSMRLSDSLTDSESYFFAEVRRLKEIMDVLDQQRCFILLDEILRGTNSDDKQIGTIEVIKKVVAKNAIGAIATHDLEVCNTTALYPETLTNKCFEVDITNNELRFDYRLREGICQNKSATFLMQKMGVI